MRFQTMWYVRPANAMTSLFIHVDFATMTVKLLTEHHFVFLSFKRVCTCSSESILVKIPRCWKSHVVAQILFVKIVFYINLSQRKKFYTMVSPNMCTRV